jgi:hypothetical protein
MDAQTLIMLAAAGLLGVMMLIWQTHRRFHTMRVSQVSEEWLARRRCRPDVD